jgi:hypothetical protein
MLKKQEKKDEKYDYFSQSEKYGILFCGNVID